jgi:hypothetical protein
VSALTARGRYLAEVMALLYPPPHRIRLPGEPAPGGRPVAEYLVLPHLRAPRLAVPLRPPGARRAGARHLPAGGSAAARGRSLALRAALATGPGARLAFGTPVRVYGEPGADSFAAHLAEVLARPVAMCVHIGGPRRANRKPVVEVGDGAEVLGFAKLGVNELTADLVRAETAALRVLTKAGLIGVRVPAVEYAGAWDGHEVLLQSALAVWRPAVPAGAERVAGAAVEVARAAGTVREPLRASGYWRALRDRLTAVDGRAAGRELAGAADRLVGAAGGTELELGSWHGDWSPWNMHPLADALLVWDWERFATGVPVGFDALHYFLQAAYRRRDIGPARAVDVLCDAGAGLLAPFGVGGAAARLTALLYLVDVACRYVADRADGDGAALTAVDDWLLPPLARRVGRLVAEGES